MTLTLYKVICPVKKVNMENEEEDNKKSKKNVHSEYKKFIPASWVKYIQEEIKKRLLLGDNDLINENNDEQSNSSIKIISRKLIHKNELFRIKVHNNILISLLKNNLKITLKLQMTISNSIIIRNNYWIPNH